MLRCGDVRGVARTAVVGVLAVVLILAVLLGWGYWYYLKRDVPIRYADPLERYKYQSVGAEPTAIPYYIWKVLPEICPDTLPPEGYAGFGWIFEEGHDRPIGMTLRTIGVERAGINCAACHTGRVRTSPTAAPIVVPGMTSNTLDLQRYARYLLQCIASPNYDSAKVMDAIDRIVTMGPLDHAVYRYVIVPGTKIETQRLAHRLDWMDSRPPFGPGRFDAFSPVKVDFGFDMTKDDAIATVDYPVIWNQRARAGMSLHWDGSNSSQRSRNIAASISAGAIPDTLDLEEVDWTTEFLESLPPPKYPFPVDAALAAEGRLVYEAHCSRCHAPGGARTGRTTPVADIATDRRRYDAFNQEFADRMNTLGEGYVWKVQGYQQTDGYLNLLLDGVWARAPYLHNGSVPTMQDLLARPEDRPVRFFRGHDVYDPVALGFVSSGPDAERAGQLHDTTLPGNGNGGHLYGVDLGPESKRALIEFLKTL